MESLKGTYPVGPPGIKFSFSEGIVNQDEIDAHKEYSKQWRKDNMERPTEEQKKAILSRVKEARKYFTPDISDIRVGYECEIWWNWNMLPKNEWCPIIIGDKNTEDFDFIDFTSRIPKAEIRIPFLSKEDIEGEGWELANVLEEDDNENDMFSTGFEKYIDENNWYSLVQKEDNKVIIYKSWYRNSVTRLTRTLFYGECKSINEFKYISKLLHI